MVIKRVQLLILTLTAAVKSLSTSQSAVRNKCAVESTAVRKSNEKENREHLPSTSTSNKSSYETIQPSDYLYGNIISSLSFPKQIATYVFFL